MGSGKGADIAADSDGNRKTRSGNGIGHFFGALKISGFRPTVEFKETMVRVGKLCMLHYQM